MAHNDDNNTTTDGSHNTSTAVGVGCQCGQQALLRAWLLRAYAYMQLAGAIAYAIGAALTSGCSAYVQAALPAGDRSLAAPSCIGALGQGCKQSLANL